MLLKKFANTYMNFTKNLRILAWIYVWHLKPFELKALWHSAEF